MILHLVSSGGTVLNPVLVSITKAGLGNPLSPRVVIPVDGSGKSRVDVHVFPRIHCRESVLHGLVRQPLIELRRSDHVINEALQRKVAPTFLKASIVKWFQSRNKKKTRQFQEEGGGGHLDVESDEHLSEVVNLKHGSCTVVRDAVTLGDELGGNDLPGQPPLIERSVRRQEVGEVTGLAATEPCLG